MATVGRPIRGRKPPSYARKVVVRVSGGRAIIQAWPKKRGRPLNPITIEQNLKFREANQLAKYAPSDDQWMAIEVTKDGPWYPRDLLMSAMFGRLFETITVDGRKMVSMAVIEDISSDLDLIGSQDHGTVLFRGEELWKGLGPGVVGEVLTSGGPTADPFWGGGGGGGGKYIVTNQPNTVADGAALNTKGTPFKIARTVTVSELGCMVTAVATDTYVGRVFALDATNMITSISGTTASITGLTAGRQELWTGLAAPVVMSAGTRYFVAWSTTNQGNTFASPFHGSVTNAELFGLPEEFYALAANANVFARVALTNPVVGTPVTPQINARFHTPMVLAA